MKIQEEYKKDSPGITICPHRPPCECNKMASTSLERRGLSARVYWNVARECASLEMISLCG